MPHHKSCKKRVRTSKVANGRNRMVRSELRTAIKKTLGATAKDDAATMLRDAFSLIDKAAKRGLIPKSNASNKKSRLAKAVQKLSV